MLSEFIMTRSMEMADLRRRIAANQGLVQQLIALRSCLLKRVRPHRQQDLRTLSLNEETLFALGRAMSLARHRLEELEAVATPAWRDLVPAGNRRNFISTLGSRVAELDPNSSDPTDRHRVPRARRRIWT